MEPRPVPVAFSEALKVWLKIGCLGFGGPAGQIALMHRVLVDEKKWVEEGRYLHALNFCMLLPGPEAQKLATYVGWLLHGVKGGLAAGILFVLPGALVMLAVSLLYVLGEGVPAVEGALFGIKAAVLVIVVEALIRIGRRGLKTRLLMSVAALAFVGIFFLDLPFPLIIAVAALAGFVTTKKEARERTASYGWAQSVRAAVAGTALWIAPVVLVVLVFGTGHVLFDIAMFFSKLAVVSFGGAYALLAYMAQQAVENYGWMSATEMVDGLGLAETLPGPLIKVTQFVGFLAAWRDPAPFSPAAAAVVGSALTTWVTFALPMMLIFAGAPFIEQLRSNRRLSGALAAVTAAVVGVILNLTIWFALHVLFADVEEARAGWLRWYAFDPASLHIKAAALALVAAVLMLRLHRGLVETVAVMAGLGVLIRFLA
ncbi:MAG TPA: chromate efflux transporter [Burkholderiales bacterium]|nr:chromate efflux transporter [Burkholderiales bacterium]